MPTNICWATRFQPGSISAESFRWSRGPAGSLAPLSLSSAPEFGWLKRVIETDDSGAQVGRKFVPGFGEMFLDKLGVAHIEEWRAGIARLIQAGDYAPTTCNSWLSVLRVILQAAKRELGLSGLATEGVKDFDESEHETYSEEEPNALLPEEVPLFLGAMRELFPQHYAMVFLGMVTGLRPSSLRPLRRLGPKADVLWDEHKVLVRRSHTLGDEVMNTTKQRVKYRIHLPEAAMDVLCWHVGTQLATAEMNESELLFPAIRAATDRRRCSTSRSRGGWSGDRSEQALHPARASADVQRPGEGGPGRGRGHQEHPRAPDGADAGALLDGRFRRAAGQHREGDRLRAGEAGHE